MRARTKPDHVEPKPALPVAKPTDRPTWKEIYHQIDALDPAAVKQLARNCKLSAAKLKRGGCAELARLIAGGKSLDAMTWADGQNTGRRRQKQTHARQGPTVYERIMEERKKDPNADVADIIKRARTTPAGYQKAMQRKIKSRTP
jgi:hypothetical protein